MLYWVYVFLFKQKTAYEMRISDWSSDVCSSDLLRAVGREEARHETRVLPGGLATKRRESREMFEPFAPDRRDAAQLVSGVGPRSARPNRPTVDAARKGIGNREQRSVGAAAVGTKTRPGEKPPQYRHSPLHRMFPH